MKIGRKFNVLTVDEYFFFIDNHRKYEDFNTLGLYRSILENELLTLDDKIQVREYAHKYFKKSFEFLQLKDPNVFIGVSTLEHNLTKGDEEKIWNDIRKNQQRILADKRIKHRNFGTYSKHLCPYEDCIWNGIMIRKGSMLAETNIHFFDDKTKWSRKLKSQTQKSFRKNETQLINNELLD